MLHKNICLAKLHTVKTMAAPSTTLVIAHQNEHVDIGVSSEHANNLFYNRHHVITKRNHLHAGIGGDESPREGFPCMYMKGAPYYDEAKFEHNPKLYLSKLPHDVHGIVSKHAQNYESSRIFQQDGSVGSTSCLTKRNIT